MNNFFRKSFILLTVLIVALQLNFLQPNVSFASNLDSAVTITVIDFEGKELIETTAVSIEEGDTAWDVLDEVAEIDGNSGFINGINGTYSDWNTFNNWWGFIVNGKYAEVGASSYDVKHGDNILYLLTDNMDENTDVMVSALINEDKLIDEISINLAPYSTAYDAIVQAASAEGLALDVSVHSQWLTFINDLDNSITGDNEFWSLFINGEPSQVGALGHRLTADEHVSLQLTKFEVPDEPSLDVAKVQSGIKTKVKANTQIQVEDTKIAITTPADLPDETTVAVEVLEEDKDVTEEFEIAGTIVDVTFEYPEEQTDYDGNFTLTLPYNSDQYEEVDIYYYDEKESKWIPQGGTVNKHISTVSVDVNHFSKYAVLALVEDELDGQDRPEQGTGDSTERTEEQQKLAEQVQEEIRSLAEYVLNNNLATAYGHEWWVWPFGMAGYDVPEQYIASVEKFVQENDGEIDSVMELEKIIIALSHAEVDVTNIAGYNLIDQLVAHEQLESPNMINAAVYGLIAANSADYEVDAQFENRLLDYILTQQLASGGWTYFGSKPSADITAMTLIALAPYQEDRPEVKDAIVEAINYLSEAQADNGAYYDELNGGYASETIAQVIIGLVAVGEDPTGAKFTKNQNLLESLLEYRTTDGLYKHLQSDNISNTFATQQAFLAFVYYAEQLGIENLPVEQDDPEKVVEQPEEGEIEPGDEEEENGEISSEQNDKTGIEGKTLPKTSTNNFNLLVLGLLFVGVGISMIVLRRKWKVE